MFIKKRPPAAAAGGVCLGLAAALLAQSCSSSSPTTSRPLTISAGLSQTHFWVGNYMDSFADAIERRLTSPLPASMPESWWRSAASSMRWRAA